jgi:fucose permease
LTISLLLLLLLIETMMAKVVMQKEALQHQPDATPEELAELDRHVLSVICAFLPVCLPVAPA